MELAILTQNRLGLERMASGLEANFRNAPSGEKNTAQCESFALYETGRCENDVLSSNHLIEIWFVADDLAAQLQKIKKVGNIAPELSERIFLRDEKCSE